MLDENALRQHDNQLMMYGSEGRQPAQQVYGGESIGRQPSAYDNRGRRERKIMERPIYQQGTTYSEAYQDTPLLKAVATMIGEHKEDEMFMHEMSLLQKTLNDIVVSTPHEYISQLLFPEYYPAARIPWEFPIPTSVFSHKDHFYFDVNANGSFGMVFVPQHTGPTSNFIEFYTDPTFAINSWGPISDAQSDEIEVYYDRVRLNGAVAVVSWLGTLDDASGVMVGGVDYGYNPAADRTVDNVEDSYFLQRSNPFDGLRMTWWPRDNGDFEFRGPGHIGDEAILCYGQAFPPNSRMRVDVERHFEGIPNTKIRDYTEVKRAPRMNSQADPIATVKNLQNKMPFLANIKQKDVGEVVGAMSSVMPFLDKVLDKAPHTGSSGGPGGSMFNTILKGAANYSPDIFSAVGSMFGPGGAVAGRGAGEALKGFFANLGF